ncbi:MAG: hypothetical protein RL748_4401 [Pseudomonadota bacterium]
MTFSYVRNLLGSLLAGATLMLAASVANAGTYTFTQTGFSDGATVSGFFQGLDQNHDGHIVGSEIWNFSAVIHGGLYDGVVFETNRRYGAFISYDVGSGWIGDGVGEKLDAFSGLQIGWISGASGGNVYDGFGSYPSSVSRNLIQVTEPTAVPEPESWAMMLSGLGALALLARRKQAKKSA